MLPGGSETRESGMTTEEERPLHGPPRPDGGRLHAAAGQLQEMFGVYRQLDHVLHASAKRVGGVEFESIFNPISSEAIAARPRMDAINHDQVFLRSSPLSAAETEAALGLLEILHGDFAAPNTEHRSVRRIHQPGELLRPTRRGTVIHLRRLTPGVPGRRLQPRVPDASRPTERLRSPRHPNHADDRPAVGIPRGDGTERHR